MAAPNIQNAESAGYAFEKGRQRAQNEAQAQRYYTSQPQTVSKKNSLEGLNDSFKSLNDYPKNLNDSFESPNDYKITDIKNPRK